jgi:phospholipid/cholesterol/gamma-HCH transport system ATP-binding protein
MPERRAVGRRQARVREIMHTLPPAAQEAIREDLEGTSTHRASAFPDAAETARHRQLDDDAPTGAIPTAPER